MGARPNHYPDPNRKGCCYREEQPTDEFPQSWPGAGATLCLQPRVGAASVGHEQTTALIETIFRDSYLRS